jgi:uncharacterized protein YbcI
MGDLPDPAAAVLDGRARSQLTNRLVKVISEATGKGPTRARIVVDRHWVLLIAEDVLTHAERQLVAAGRSELVRETRRRLHAVMCPELERSVAEAAGRPVTAVLSDMRVEDDVVLTAFRLQAAVVDDEPRGPRVLVPKRRGRDPELNVEFVHLLWRAMLEEGIDAVVDLVPADSRWRPGGEQGPLLRGVQELSAYWDGRDEQMPEPVAMEAHGDDVLVTAEWAVGDEVQRIGAAQPRLWLTTSMLWPSGSSTNAP